ncbi:hypothetical protein FLW53_28505 [Microbispora sp. SCL1-1]|uniref:hypothetical protein n=1 Tax=unclassified Microbispora TaxID=2614687 RepID=UPI00115A8AF0|nr:MULTISPECIES: hypothetical protein [unclassified Microbispora]NJP28072.1 hypothetical protein [Microbispora sp. CL1-1]TQS09431.1 hypothetical protein FLW53_28505 [Microbispora sp. SCL1-1]
MTPHDHTLEPGLRTATRVIAQHIAELEADIVTQSRDGHPVHALYAAYTASYLRDLLVHLVGPTWHYWAAEQPPPACDTKEE